MPVNILLSCSDDYTMKVLDLLVRESVAVSASAQRLVLAAPDASLLPTVLPGQFVEVRIDDTPGVLLRRPISVHDCDPAGGTLVLLVQRVGKGTAWLCCRKAGDVVNVVLPLGNGFSLPTKTLGFRPILIGGGVGVAPLLLLGKELTRRGAEPTFLLGARTEKDLLCLERFEKAARTLVSTENGVAGEKGFVTQHSVLGKERFDHIYTCGPLPMMKAVARLAREKAMTCEVSLENRMACGLGACLCCVEDTTSGNVCVCKEGPVFSIDRLKWFNG